LSFLFQRDTSPKIENSVIIYFLSSSAEHKERYFEERLEPNSCGAPLTSIVEKINTMEVVRDQDGRHEESKSIFSKI